LGYVTKTTAFPATPDWNEKVVNLRQSAPRSFLIQRSLFVDGGWERGKIKKRKMVTEGKETRKKKRRSTTPKEINIKKAKDRNR
jgi:hypothetical protein